MTCLRLEGQVFWIKPIVSLIYPLSFANRTDMRELTILKSVVKGLSRAQYHVSLAPVGHRKICTIYDNEIQNHLKGCR